jgi:hypothetical protein
MAAAREWLGKTLSRGNRYACNNTGTVFSTWSVPRCYKQGKELELGKKYKRLKLGGGKNLRPFK